MEWAPGALAKARMIPMAQPSWDSLLALPDGAEVVLVFILPLSIGYKLMLCDVNETMRKKVRELRDSNNMMPALMIVALDPDAPSIPEPEAFAEPKGPLT